MAFNTAYTQQEAFAQRLGAASRSKSALRPRAVVFVVVTLTLAFSLSVPAYVLPVHVNNASFPASQCAYELAWAEDIDTDPQPDELQLRVEQTAAALEEAQARVAEAADDVEQNQAKIDEIERVLPAQKKRSENAARELYKLQQQSGSVIDLFLSSGSFGEFLQNLEYVNRISESNITEANRLSTTLAELEETQAELDAAHEDAVKLAAEAESALIAAQEARLEAQRRAEEEARRRAEEAAAAAAAAAAAEKAAQEQAAREAEARAAQQQQAADDSRAETPSAPATSSSSGVTLIPDGADWTLDEASFISEWTGRIDAYLAGSPLAGQGKTFAKAAWDYGIDPRWSPAISNTESSKGAVCFLPHNAWGWGSVSWDSWEEAINDHVRGLARGYGYTITPEAAAKYCPPNATHWYEVTVGQMNMI
ncbi:MAG: hypothetical protein IJH04_11265 [Eggerthellaceae bacterium]|nr:hypothetical protein [Eggerthellaceae bacterium]